MAEESQVVTFTSEQEKFDAINALDESPENVDKIQEYRNAEIKEKTEEAEPEEGKTTEVEPTDDTTASQETTEEVEPDKKPEETTTTQDAETFQLTKEDLPEGFKNAKEVLKSFSEKQKLIERQGTKIQETLASQDQLIEAAKQKAIEDYEAKLRESTQKPEGASDTQKTIPDSGKRITEIKTEMAKIDDPYDEKIHKLQTELNDLNYREMERLNQLVVENSQKVTNVGQNFEQWQESQRQTQLQKQNEASVNKDFTEVSDFASKEEYKKDFGMSKSSQEVDAEYGKWGNDVHLQYFGRPVERDAQGKVTNQGRINMQNALAQLQLSNPDLIEKCKVANISTEPTADMESYLQICEILTYRDGWRKDPEGNYTKRVMKFDPGLQKEIPAVFPSLQAAFENMRVQDGYYKRKEIAAYDKGAKGFREASQKRDSNELENDTVGHGEAELTLTQLMENLKNIPEDNTPENQAKLKEYKEKVAELIKQGNLK